MILVNLLCLDMNLFNKIVGISINSFFRAPFGLHVHVCVQLPTFLARQSASWPLFSPAGSQIGSHWVEMEPCRVESGFGFDGLE